MLFNSLTLRNFGPYVGEHVFDLRSAFEDGHSKNVILVGGMNGCGKTTILDAVQLVLYGNRAKCSKRNGAAYSDFLMGTINTNTDPERGAAIRLEFLLRMGGDAAVYHVTRSWKQATSTLRESIEVCKDGRVDKWLSANWNLVVEEILPYGIAELCFFDAEKISSLAEDASSTKAVSEAINSLLGLDLVERLISDCRITQSRIASRSAESADAAEIRRLEERLVPLKRDLVRLKQERASLENDRLRAEEDVRKAELAYAEMGGKHWENREKQSRRRGQLDEARRVLEQGLVTRSTGPLPLAMVLGLLRSMYEQATKESDSQRALAVEELLEQRDTELINMARTIGLNDNQLSAIEKTLSCDRKRRRRHTAQSAWLGLSSEGEELLSGFLTRGCKAVLSECANSLDRCEGVIADQASVQRDLAAVPKEDALKGVARELKRATSRLAQANQLDRKLEADGERMKSEIAAAERALAVLRERIVDEQIRSDENSRVLTLLGRTQDSMKQYLEVATRRKVGRLSQSITECLRFLSSKSSLVHQVIIEPRSYALSLFADDGTKMPRDRLSQGEKQILAISVLWGLLQSSHRSLPVIVDTPMARLDSRHRDRLVEQYFPNASHQVVVLSTDTEVERSYFDALKPHIARSYHLHYDETTKSTEPSSGYFWESSLKETRHTATNQRHK